MKKIYYAVLVQQSLPQELLSFLKGYLHPYRDMTCLLCSEFVDLGSFLEMRILANSENKQEWKVKVRTQYVLALGEVEDSGDFPLGFLS